MFCQISLVNSGKALGNDDIAIGPDVLTSVKLFRGYVQFTKQQTAFLSDMFQSVHARPIILSLLALRHRTRYFDRSDLDDFASGAYR